MQNNPEVEEDLGREGQIKNWIQDNIRVIFSVLIVVAIAAGIYSYSKRGVVEENEVAMVDVEKDENSSDENKNEDSDTEEVKIVSKEDESEASELTEEEKRKLEQKLADAAKKQEKDEPVIVAEVDENKTEKKAEEKKEMPKEMAKEEPKKEDNAQSSEETNEAFVEKAQRGDSLTVLARRATKNYLEKNNLELTTEHKIYVEDYLSKSVGKKRLVVGGSVSFSKTLIQDAIEKANTLKPNQLENLKKYSSRVSNI